MAWDENARRPNLKPMRKPRPGSEPCATPSTWRSSRHSGATSGAQGSAGQLPGGAKTSEPAYPRRRPLPTPQDGGQELWRPAAVNRLGIPGLVVDSKEVMTSRPLAKAPDVLNEGVDRGVPGVAAPWPAEA